MDTSWAEAARAAVNPLISALAGVGGVAAAGWLTTKRERSSVKLNQYVDLLSNLADVRRLYGRLEALDPELAEREIQEIVKGELIPARAKYTGS